MPTEKKKDPNGLQQTLAHLIEDARAEVVSSLWETAYGVRLTSQEEMMSLMSQLTVLDDIFQDLLVDCVPLRFLHNESQFYATIARDIARWNARGHSLAEGACPQGKVHGPQDPAEKLHRIQGEAYIHWSTQLLERVTQYLGEGVH